MVDKRISDLEATTTLEGTTVFHIRKTETNEDFKITKSNLVKQIGNSVVSGFNATSPLANRLLLTPSNSGSLDQYYDGMTIKFISPIHSTDLVKIKIGTLDYIDFKTTFTNPITNLVENGVLKTGKFYEAIYSNNSFIQTNIDRQYTNEYLSIGEIIFDNTTQEYFTLYTLTSATSFYKTSYYEGMSIVFTSGIINNSVENMSNGKIYINVDGLGQKLLSDPDGDGVPFSLQPNETILGIYDGEKFIKNMFTMQEPELPVPVDPDNPPPGYDITVYVGPNEPEVSNRLLQTAYERIIKDYGYEGGGRRVLIKFRDNYTGQGLTRSYETKFGAYITIEGNANVIMFPGENKAIFFLQNASIQTLGYSRFLNLTGTWKCRFPQTGFNISDEYCFIYVSILRNEKFIDNIFIKDALIENENLGNQNFYFIKQLIDYTDVGTPQQNINLENVELKNFGAIQTPSFSSLNFTPTDPSSLTFTNVVLTNTISQARTFNKPFFKIGRNFKADGLQINITKPSNYNQFNVRTGLIEFVGHKREDTTVVLENCNIILNDILQTMPIISIGVGFNNMNITLEGCIIKYNSTLSNTRESILLWNSKMIPSPSTLTIFGNDFANKNTLTTPDILIDNTNLFIRSSTTTASTASVNGGIITVIQ